MDNEAQPNTETFRQQLNVSTGNVKALQNIVEQQNGSIETLQIILATRDKQLDAANVNSRQLEADLIKQTNHLQNVNRTLAKYIESNEQQAEEFKLKLRQLMTSANVRRQQIKTLKVTNVKYLKQIQSLEERIANCRTNKKRS